MLSFFNLLHLQSLEKGGKGHDIGGQTSSASSFCVIVSAWWVGGGLCRTRPPRLGLQERVALQEAKELNGIQCGP